MTEQPASELAADPGEGPPVAAMWCAPVGMAPPTAVAWLAERRPAFDVELARSGVVLVRGLPLRGPADMAALGPALGGPPVRPREWFARREEPVPAVYGPAPWPEDRTLCQYNECAYDLTPPARLAVACLRPAQEGGETILTDCRRVLAALPPSVVDRARASGWELVRHYRRYVGQHWSDAFATDDPAQVEAYCTGQQVEWDWLPDSGLRTSRRRAAIVRHPDTGQECWFNQLGFLSRWALEASDREVLEAAYGPAGLPTQTRFGDGTTITEPEYGAIEAAYRGIESRVRWQAGDLLLLDNLLIAHGRLPYRGRQELAVTMLGRADLRGQQ